MDFHEFKVGDKVMVNVPNLSVPIHNNPGTVSEIRTDNRSGADSSLYVLTDDVGEYLGVFHPSWLTLATGDPWNPVMRSEQEVRATLSRMDDYTVTLVLRWVLGELPEWPLD